MMLMSIGYKAMDKLKPYYFSIEAINENGVSKRTQVIKSQNSQIIT